jgi:hypothetical protein
MREAFVILFVIALLLGLTAFKYRKQVIAAYRFWGMLRDVQKKNSSSQMPEPAVGELGPLVNCAKCGKWVPETQSIRLGTRMFYCSSACLEKAATAA